MLFVVIPSAWRNKIGNEHIDSYDNRLDSLISEFANVSEADLVYIQRPQTISEAISHYLTIASGVCLRE